LVFQFSNNKGMNLKFKKRNLNIARTLYQIRTRTNLEKSSSDQGMDFPIISCHAISFCSNPAKNPK